MNIFQTQIPKRILPILKKTLSGTKRSLQTIFIKKYYFWLEISLQDGWYAKNARQIKKKQASLQTFKTPAHLLMLFSREARIWF